MKNISKEDYIIWNTKLNSPAESLDIVYHYTTVIEMINDRGLHLLGDEELIPVASLPIKWQQKISEAIELTK